jgi:tRNA(Ile)-lysidine synthase TilS/MesJ
MLAPLRKAVVDYNMIEEKDVIAVGVSGGKDSLALLTLLAAYRRFSPQKFDIKAFTIDLGFKGANFSPVEKYCKELNVEFFLEKTNIAEALAAKCPQNPCSLCSKMRRGALNTLLLQKGCNKLALGHHADDVIETFFLSMCYEGRLSTFAPISYMSRTKVSVIRPMIYIYEGEIAAYAKKLPVLHNPCPADKHTQREYMKNLIKNIQKDIPAAKDRIKGAIMSPDRYNLWEGVIKKYQKQLSDGEEEQG